MKMGNSVPRMRMEPASLAFHDRMLSITPPSLPDVPQPYPDTEPISPRHILIMPEVTGIHFQVIGLTRPWV